MDNGFTSKISAFSPFSNNFLGDLRQKYLTSTSKRKPKLNIKFFQNQISESGMCDSGVCHQME